MPIRSVHQVLINGFGRGWRDRFAEFGEEPSAAASIGQVHRPVWQDGRPGAVKVQYPGAGAALAADLRQLDRLVPLLLVAAPGLHARGLFAELRTRVMAEVDYRQGAVSQNAFAQVFRDDPDFLVPSVVAVTDRVLISDSVDGTPVAQAVRRGAESQCQLVMCWVALDQAIAVADTFDRSHVEEWKRSRDEIAEPSSRTDGATRPVLHPVRLPPPDRGGVDGLAGEEGTLAARHLLARPGFGPGGSRRHGREVFERAARYVNDVGLLAEAEQRVAAG